MLQVLHPEIKQERGIILFHMEENNYFFIKPKQYPLRIVNIFVKIELQIPPFPLI